MVLRRLQRATENRQQEEQRSVEAALTLSELYRPFVSVDMRWYFARILCSNGVIDSSRGCVLRDGLICFLLDILIADSVLSVDDILWRSWASKPPWVRNVMTAYKDVGFVVDVFRTLAQ